MKTLTIVDEQGEYTITTKTTLTQIAQRLGSYALALPAMRMLLLMEHNCDKCGHTESSHVGRNQHLCEDCL